MISRTIREDSRFFIHYLKSLISTQSIIVTFHKTANSRPRDPHRGVGQRRGSEKLVYGLWLETNIVVCYDKVYGKSEPISWFWGHATVRTVCAPVSTSLLFGCPDLVKGSLLLSWNKPRSMLSLSHVSVRSAMHITMVWLYSAGFIAARLQDEAQWQDWEFAYDTMVIGRVGI